MFFLIRANSPRLTMLSNYARRRAWNKKIRSRTSVQPTDFAVVYAVVLNTIYVRIHSIKISAAVLPRDKCCTEITVAADLVPKVQYISSGLGRHAETPMYHRHPDTRLCAGLPTTKWVLHKRANQIASTYFKLSLGSEISRTSVSCLARTIFKERELVRYNNKKLLAVILRTPRAPIFSESLL